VAVGISTLVTVGVLVLLGLVIGVTILVRLAVGTISTVGVAVGVITGATAHPIRHNSKGGIARKHWQNTVMPHRGGVTSTEQASTRDSP